MKCMVIVLGLIFCVFWGFSGCKTDRVNVFDPGNEETTPNPIDAYIPAVNPNCKAVTPTKDGVMSLNG